MSPERVVALSRIGTVAFVVTAVAAAVWPDPLDVVSMVTAVALGVLGCVAFARAFVQMAGRSRHEAITVPGVFFLTGAGAPRAVRVRLLGDLGAQIVVALVTASVRPFSPLAFGVLVPVFGFGMCGLWGAAAGRFPPRRI